MTDSIHDAGVTGLSRLYAGSVSSPLEVLAAYMTRVHAANDRLNAFVFLDSDGAREAAARSAERWRAGRPLSVLDGVPFGVKANIAVRGWPWHAGIAAYRDRIATADALCVGRLRAAGAILLGLVNMDEAALGAMTDNSAFGRCRNPHDLSCTAGGSSGGSAVAVAAGLCAAALGTDTMGSVRIPASYCGVFGHKPRSGVISTAGVTPLSRTLDTVGVLTRSAPDLATVMSVLDPEGPRPAFGGDKLDGVRLGVPASDQRVEARVAHAFQSTLDRARRRGAQVEVVRLDGDVLEARRAALLVSAVEGAREHAAMRTQRPEGFSPRLHALFAWGERQSAEGLASAYQRLAGLGPAIREAVAGCDAVLTPTTPQVAFAFDGEVPMDVADFTLLGNIAGLAVTAFPVGSTSPGLPASVQAMAKSAAVGWRLASILGLSLSPRPSFAGEDCASVGLTSTR